MTTDFILWVVLNFTIQFTLFLRTTRCARGVPITLAGFGVYLVLGTIIMRVALPIFGSTTTMIQCCFFPFYLLVITLLLLLMKGNLGHRLFICLESTVYCSAFIIARHLFATRLPPGILRHVLAFGAPILIALILFFKVIPLLERMPRRANWTVLNLVAAGSVLFVFFSCFWPVWVAAGNWTDLVRGGFALGVALTVLPVGLAYVAALRRDYANRRSADRNQMMLLELKALRAEADGARRVRHNLRHHIDEMGVLLHANDLPAALKYLENLSGHELLKPSTLKRWCENELVNGLVCLAEARAVKHGLAFTADIHLEGLLPLNESDLVSLLGNLLENAVLGAVSSVSLRLNCAGNSLRLMVENTVPANFKLVNGLPCEEPDVGIRSLQSVIAKYHGLFKYELEGNTLSARVFIGSAPPPGITLKVARGLSSPPRAASGLEEYRQQRWALLGHA